MLLKVQSLVEGSLQITFTPHMEVVFVTVTS